MQNNEWVQDSRQEDVLKALDHYYRNNVRFMLEKGSTSKDLVISVKAKRYPKKSE